MPRKRLIISARGPQRSHCAVVTANRQPGRALTPGLLLVLVAGLAFSLTAQFTAVGDTTAHFQDPESSPDNVLQAGSLVFNLSSMDDDYGSYTAPGTDIGTEAYQVTTMQPEGSLPAAYTVSGVLDPTNEPGCNQLQVSAIFGDYAYAGPFMDFASLTMTSMGEWQFFVSLLEYNNDLTPGAICKGEFVFKTSLAGIDDTLTNTYSDDKQYTFEITNWLPAEESLAEVQPLLADEPLDNDISEPEPVVLGETQENIVLDTLVTSDPEVVEPPIEPPSELEPVVEPKLEPEISPELPTETPPSDN